MECFEKALNIAREAGDQATEGDIYVCLGVVYTLRSDLPKAIEWCEKSLPIVREEGSPAKEGTVYLILGILYNSHNDLPKAIECFEKASNCAREAGDRDTEGRACLNLGIVYNSRYDLPKAIESYEKALNIARKAADRAGVIPVSQCLEDCYLALGDVVKRSERRANTEEATEGSASIIQGNFYRYFSEFRKQ